MDAREFLSELAELRRTQEEAGVNPGCVEIEGCTGCSNCVFCRDCVRCHRLRYSTGCRDSYDLTHCTRCTSCYASNFATDCHQCVSCSHVVLCTSCADCDYCFGCVGLKGKDFHILNKKHSRSDFFRITKALSEEVLRLG